MKISAKGLEFIENWEGCKLEVYPDQAKKPTIGVGHLLTPSEKKTGFIQIGSRSLPYRHGISKEDAMALLDQDTDRFESLVDNEFPRRLFQHEFDALTAFCFNIGAGSFKGSTCVRRLKAFDTEGAMEAWKWFDKVTVDGKKVTSDGLVKRRAAEIALYRDADYSGKP